MRCIASCVSRRRFSAPLMAKRKAALVTWAPCAVETATVPRSSLSMSLSNYRWFDLKRLISWSRVMVGSWCTLNPNIHHCSIFPLICASNRPAFINKDAIMLAVEERSHASRTSAHKSNIRRTIFCRALFVNISRICIPKLPETERLIGWDIWEECKGRPIS